MELDTSSLHHPSPPRLSRSVALFLDFDGTLADIASRPGDVRISASLGALLGALRCRLSGAVALLTGRRLSEVDDLLATPGFPGAGVHGAELRLQPHGDVSLQWRPDTGALLRGLREHFGSDSRILIEDKLVAVAVHYRLAPERAAECHEVLNLMLPGEEMEIMRGHMVVEARPRGASKGRALQVLMQQEPFSGRVPVYVGDDNTDEEAFAAAAALGGFGVKVGTGTTHAHFRCADVASVHAWLNDSLGEMARPH